MKIFYALLFAISAIGNISIAQVSVQDGNWTNPTTWDCNCIPQPYLPAPIDVTINHVVVADIFDPVYSLSGRTYFDGGSLTIGPNGTLLQTGEGDLLMDGATTLVNGTLDMRRVAIDYGTATYNGIIQNCDSLWNDNSNVINNGVITTYDHQVYPDGTMTNNGTINITNNMNIQGEYTNTASGDITIAFDFSNTNVFGGRALYINNGSHTIMNNFINTTNDTIKGSGTLCIGNLSTNQGAILGSMTVTTPTASFSLNTGFVASSINFNTGNCSATISEFDLENSSIYPNPTSGKVSIDLGAIYNEVEVKLSNMLGQQLSKSTFTQTDHIELEIEDVAGFYIIEISTPDHKIITTKLLKE